MCFFLILNASGDINPFASKLHCARASPTHGLRPGSEVRLAGVRIGKWRRSPVAAVECTGDKRVEASFAVDSKIDAAANQRIRTDSMALQAGPACWAVRDHKLTRKSVGQQYRRTQYSAPSAANTISDFATSGTDLAQR